ncbi:unnamed protein product [Phytophthora lilii]|uniref:Unnamed protein product n=1 Tax=Phytophthora lilii TaxID=2077276 RepID=A0A9W6X9M6_9STRA|nr:unnamed protein product [Phytophthora lilii]
MSTASPLRRRRGAKPAAKPAPSPAELLVAAVRAGDAAAFAAQLQTPLDVNRRTRQGDAPLVEACRFARLDMATSLLLEHKANANVASVNRSANRVGLTPLVAACMALRPDLVQLLLTQSQKKVNLLKNFGRVNALTVTLLFCVANGRTDEQNDRAVEILLILLRYAKQQNQLKAVLSAKPDKVNSLLHVAAGLGNWKALKMLREHADEFEVDFNARNAVEHSALHVVELNSFQARSLQFCEPPRPEVEVARKGKKRNGRKSRQKKQEKEEEQESEKEKEELMLDEQQSEAGTMLLGSAKLELGQILTGSAATDKQTFTRSRPDRTVEAYHVTRTVMELTKTTGTGAIFSRKGDEGVRGLYIKTLIAEMPDTQKEKAVYMDGLMYTVASVYPLSVKNAKEYQSLWRQALDKQTSDDLQGNNPVQNEEEEKKSPPQALQLSHDAFKMVLSGMLSYNSLSKRVKVWTLILMHLLDPYAAGAPLGINNKPIMEECGQLRFFERITEMLYRSGTKLAFCIFDRTDIEDDESYDEEIEFHLLISLVELFLQFFAPYALTIRDGEKGVLGVTDSFQRAIKPVKQLWSLVNAALGSLDDAIATPQRFSLLLHLLQVFEQLEAAFISDESAALTKLFKVCCLNCTFFDV